MQLKDQVVSLELAKKLKELGVKQESLFLWVEISEKRAEVASYEEMRGNMPDKTYIHSAFTVAELGEMLPDWIAGEQLYSLQMHRAIAPNRAKHHIAYWFMGDVCLHKTHADTEADARAKMLIYLLENQLITK